MRRFAAFICMVLILFSLTSCTYDKPPGADLPELGPLNGIFVCGDSTMSFSGDGKSVSLNISEELSEKTGLPSGESSGTYVFLFRNEKWRYDKAEYVRFIIEGKNYQFSNDFTKTNEDIVAFYSNFDNSEIIIFNKENN